MRHQRARERIAALPPIDQAEPFGDGGIAGRHRLFSV
jgi:hypothetical protein